MALVSRTVMKFLIRCMPYYLKIEGERVEFHKLKKQL